MNSKSHHIITKKIKKSNLYDFFLWFRFFILLVFFSSFQSAAYSLDANDLRNTDASSLLRVIGNNPNQNDVILVIRADDSYHPSYENRANIERVIPSGQFDISVSFANLRTPKGRQLSFSKLKQILIFSTENKQALVFDNVFIDTPKPLSKNSLAWDFGPKNSAIWPGFTLITKNSPFILGKNLTPIDRSKRKQAADPLTIDGIKGINTLLLPLTKGKWHVTLWIRDAGEWEFLPHPLQRSIYANDTLVYQQNLSAEEWVNHVYLSRRDIKVTPKSTSWNHFGQRQEARISFEVISTGEPVPISIKGDSPDATFISALLATPLKNKEVLTHLTKKRQEWWEKNWPIEKWKIASSEQTELLPKAQTLVAAPDTSALFSFTFEQNDSKGAPLVSFLAPKAEGIILPAEWHWSQWQIVRTNPASTLLKIEDNLLRSGTLPNNEKKALIRRIFIRVDIPKHTNAGIYNGKITFFLAGKSLSATFTLEVIKTLLPKLDKPVGIYLESPVHLGWFPSLAIFNQKAINCDLNFLAKLGLTGISPPYPTPDNIEKIKDFEEISNQLFNLGFFSSLAYATVKNLEKTVGTQKMIKTIAQIEQNAYTSFHQAPFWAIADEPSNHSHTDLFQTWYRQFSLLLPKAKLAGHLNNKKDKKWLSYFDLVLINQGYGVDVNDIKEAKKEVNHVWFYNLSNKRAAAGFYLWQTHADGYLQWHGRMPTADPFDPTDGREYDAQMLYPSKDICPKTPDIHLDLYQIMEGILDFRWLLWLENKAKTNQKARTLLSQLKKDIPIHWDEMEKIDEKQLNEWRSRIIDLAQPLRNETLF